MADLRHCPFLLHTPQQSTPHDNNISRNTFRKFDRNTALFRFFFWYVYESKDITLLKKLPNPDMAYMQIYLGLYRIAERKKSLLIGSKVSSYESYTFARYLFYNFIISQLQKFTFKMSFVFFHLVAGHCVVRICPFIVFCVSLFCNGV